MAAFSAIPKMSYDFRLSMSAPSPARVPSASSRLPQLDWMRGLACVLMFQTHCYDAWLSPAARQSPFFMYSQLLGTLPAPLFLFLAGVSAAMMANKVAAKSSLHTASRTIIRRGAEIWGLAMLFRVQEYLIAWHWAPWTDLLRMDVLNCIGVSLILIGLVCSFSTAWPRFVGLSAITSLAISCSTPLIWTHRMTWLPWFVETYFDGVHTQGKPLPWLFPIFPWTAFAFAGVVVGYFILSETGKRLLPIMVPVTAILGLAIAGVGYGLDHLPFQLYPVYDFWHTSPDFFLIRLGIVIIILAACDARCQMPALLSKSKALILMGQHSLLVYWVHIEFVYGRLHILPRRAETIVGATAGLLVITFSMLLLAYLRSKWETRKKQQLYTQAVPA
jgi:uncharacterized membrane protein